MRTIRSSGSIAAASLTLGSLTLGSLTLGSLTLMGCASSHIDVHPQGGIYELTVRGEIDRCAPARDTGTVGTAGVVAALDRLSVSVPDPTRGAFMQISLDGADSYHTSTSVALRACTAATLDRSFTVVSSSPDAITIAYREGWSGLSTCGEAMRSIMPAAPTADCTADLTLEYRLAEPCADHCEVTLGVAGPTCACD